MYNSLDQIKVEDKYNFFIDVTVDTKRKIVYFLVVGHPSIYKVGL